MNFSETLVHLSTGGVLGADDAEGVFLSLLNGELGEAQIAGLLSMLQLRGPAKDELVGAARAMRAHVTPVPYEPKPGESLVDTCGTGGAPKTFNVSTTAAIVAAAIEPASGSGVSRIVVAKHGNRSRTGRGSAEVFAALGVNVDASPEIQAKCLDEVGVCFCFAIHHHPAMKHAMPVRKALGFPTIFNLLGPLTNPAGATRQLIGVYRPDAVELLAGALADLGATRAIVAHGGGGLDELSTLGTNLIGSVEATTDGVHVRSERLEAGEVGLATATFESLAAQDVAASAEIVRRVLAGDGGAVRDIVLLNAGAAAMVGGACASIGEGVEMARSAIDSGRASAVLADLARCSGGV